MDTAHIRNARRRAACQLRATLKLITATSTAPIATISKILVARKSAYTLRAWVETLTSAWYDNLSRWRQQNGPTISHACRCRRLGKLKHSHCSKALFTVRSIAVLVCTRCLRESTNEASLECVEKTPILGAWFDLEVETLLCWHIPYS